MSRATILVVDDDKVIRHTLKYQLDKSGYEAVSAGSGDECMYHLKNGDIDLVFHFLLRETDLDCLSLEGTLTGELYDGRPITGTDDVRMVDTTD